MRPVGHPLSMQSAGIFCVAEVPAIVNADGSWSAYSLSRGLRRQILADAEAARIAERVELIAAAPGADTAITLRMRAWSNAWSPSELSPGSRIVVSSGVAAQLVNVGAADPA